MMTGAFEGALALPPPLSRAMERREGLACGAALLVASSSYHCGSIRGIEAASTKH